MQFVQLKRREFLGILGGAVAVMPVAASAKQPQVVGYMHTSSADALSHFVIAFRQGLKETGYIEGQNLTIEYRWAEGQYDRLPVFAGELVRRPVSLIVAGSPPAALAAKVATA